MRKQFLTFGLVAALLTLFSGYGLPSAQAANLTSASIGVTDPRPSTTGVTYTVAFTFPSTTALRCINIQLATVATGLFTAPTGMDTTSAVKGTITGGGLTNGNWTLDNSVNGVLSLTAGSGQTPTTTAVSIPVTTITNPSGSGLTNGTFYGRINTYTNVDCSTGATDTTVVALAVTSGVVINAVVDPTLTFTMAGLASAVKTTITPDAGCTTSATVVTFPSAMTPATTYYCAQRMTVSTNGDGGYTVSLRGVVSGDDMINSANPAKTIADHTGTNASPAAFGSPSTAFGYTTSAATLGTGTTGRFSSADTFAGLTQTASEVAYSNTPVSSQTTDIAYGFRFAATTSAGTYSATAVYTATPIY